VSPEGQADLRSFTRDLLPRIRDELLGERLAQAMSKAASERQFAFDLAGLIDEWLPDQVAIPECSGNSRSGLGNVDVLVVPRDSVRERPDGMLRSPEAWPDGAIAIELKDLRLANGVKGTYGYDGVLRDLRSDVVEKALKVPPSKSGKVQWLGLTVMTDGGLEGTKPRAKAEATAREVRIERWRPAPEGLLCVGSVLGQMSHRDWHGNVWIEAFVHAPEEASVPVRSDIMVAPSDRFSGNNDESLWWYAIHGPDSRELDCLRHGPAYLHVDTQAIHDYRRAQFERTGRWGGTFEELRLCLLWAERIWKDQNEPDFGQWPGVAALVGELRTAWSDEHR
jgi:hypothetical protein